MRYRIDYEDGSCSNYANSRADLLVWMKLLKDESIHDIQKLYKNGKSYSVMETYQPYINRKKSQGKMLPKEVK